MAISMYQISVPYLIHSLKNLTHILQKAEQHATEQGYDPTVLLQTRLFPNMFPLVRQVQIVTDLSKGCGARLAGVEVPKYEDTETTFQELYARLEKTIGFLEERSPEQIEGSEDKTITLTVGGQTLDFSGVTYLMGFVKPNVDFHVTTAYNILRKSGVALGKRDYLGG